MNVTGDFLTDDKSPALPHSRLHAGKDGTLPWFEVLWRVGNRSSMPREAAIVICREIRK